MEQFNKYQYVELLINPGQNMVGFTPQQYLQNRQIYGADVYSNEEVNLSRSNIAVATPAMLEGMFLNLYCTDVNLPMQAVPNSTQFSGQGWGLWFRDVPLMKLHCVQSGTTPNVRAMFGMYGELIDFEQSYVNLTPTTVDLIEAPTVVIFGFAYK